MVGAAASVPVEPVTPAVACGPGGAGEAEAFAAAGADAGGVGGEDFLAASSCACAAPIAAKPVHNFIACKPVITSMATSSSGKMRNARVIPPSPRLTQRLEHVAGWRFLDDGDRARLGIGRRAAQIRQTIGDAVG